MSNVYGVKEGVHNVGIPFLGKYKTQAGCEQAVTMARTRAEQLKAVADEAERVADLATEALGEAMRVAEEARAEGV